MTIWTGPPTPIEKKSRSVLSQFKGEVAQGSLVHPRFFRSSEIVITATYVVATVQEPTLIEFPKLRHSFLVVCPKISNSKATFWARKEHLIFQKTITLFSSTIFISLASIGLIPSSALSDRTAPILKKTVIEAPSFKGKHSFSMIKGFTRRGSKAQRFEIRHGDCGRYKGYSDCKTDRGRIERNERPKNRMSKPGQGIWYGYSIYIPKDFVSLGKGNTALSQAKVEGELFPLWLVNFNDNP